MNIIGTLLLIIMLLNCFALQGQVRRKASTQKENGIIIFEGEKNVFEMYFVKTIQQKLSSVFKVADTIKAIVIGSPGDDASNVNDFRTYLNKKIKFDILFVTINQESQLEQYYQEQTNLYSKFGCLSYRKSKSYKLATRYKKIIFNNKHVVIALDSFVPVESFVAK